ncbi:ImmA/IrrE family metallo-endopeptidase [Methylobacterium thuringiense]|uniref:ImmA/IrrE family metallo-endopeptidase n=1 Tax=Methylobacterium thuringiense TaxID=1003091 RepID=UPI001EDD4B15|nr:ImmA/IrrE family metallo-endopeptidase [Methylobacterium thuringiense]
MREELGVQLHEPLCPWKLIEHLGYNVVKLSDFASREPEAVAYLTSGVGQTEFSAVTLPNDGAPWIVHNDSHSTGRQGANLAHEAAHGLLCHQGSPLTDARGARIFNREQENEANWLGPALLISDEAAIYIAQKRLSPAAACHMYGVSNDLLQMRLWVSAAYTRVARSRAA